MQIQVTCPQGHKLKAPASYAGKQAKCPACGAVVIIPQTAQSETSQQTVGEGIPLATHSRSTPPTNAIPSTPPLSQAKVPTASPMIESREARRVKYTQADIRKATFYLLKANAEAEERSSKSVDPDTGFLADRRRRKIAEAWQGCRTATGGEATKLRQVIISYENKAIPFIFQEVNTSDPVSINNGCIILAEIATRDSPLSEIWDTLNRLRSDQRLGVEARATLARAFDWRLRVLLLMKDIADDALKSAPTATSVATAAKRIDAAVRQSVVSP